MCNVGAIISLKTSIGFERIGWHTYIGTREGYYSEPQTVFAFLGVRSTWVDATMAMLQDSGMWGF